MPADKDGVFVVRLRARATCRECDSRLPPRTEVLHDTEDDSIVCMSCARRLAPDYPPADEFAAAEGEAPFLDASPNVVAFPGQDAPASVEGGEPTRGRDIVAEATEAEPTPADWAGATTDGVPPPPPPPPPAPVPTSSPDPAVAGQPTSLPPAEPAVPSVPPASPPSETIFVPRVVEPNEVASVHTLASVDGAAPTAPKPGPDAAEPSAPRLQPTELRPARVLDATFGPARVPERSESASRSFVADGTAAVVPKSSSAGTPDTTPPPAPPPRPRVVPRPRPVAGPEVASAAGLFGRLRGPEGTTAPTRTLVSDSILVERPVLDAHVGNRGVIGDLPIGPDLEAGRMHGLEVLHSYAFDQQLVIDHVVVAANGIWVIRTAPPGQQVVDRRDLGDWFTSDPRLFVGDADRGDLIDGARRDADAVRSTLASTRNADLPVRPVICFPEEPAGPVVEPFTVAGVLVTWRRRVVETMLEPVLVSSATRSEVVDFLIAVRFRAYPTSD